MHRGCIAVGNIHCDKCGRTIKHPERYLAIEEKDGVEVDQGETDHYCSDCSLKKGYAHYKKVEKDEEIITFFPEEIGP